MEPQGLHETCRFVQFCLQLKEEPKVILLIILNICLIVNSIKIQDLSVICLELSVIEKYPLHCKT